MRTLILLLACLRPPEDSIDELFERGVAAEIRARSLEGEQRKEMLALALASYDEVLARVKDDPPTLSNRANVKAENGDLDGAIRDVETAIFRASGPDRAFYLRRSGDLLLKKGRREESALRYWQALEWNPREDEAHVAILTRLQSSPPIQLAHYLRFLLETNQTERVLAAAEALTQTSASADIAAASAVALAQAAPIVPHVELERVAEPFLRHQSEAGSELQAVLRAESRPFRWLASNDGSAAATGQPPHVAFRGLARAVGSAAAVRGDLEFAERAYRLATQMPGADENDFAQLLQFYAQYKTLPELRRVVQVEEPLFVPRPRPVQTSFNTAAIIAYALYEARACGNVEWGVRHHVVQLTALGADPPAIAREICPADVPADLVRDASCVLPDGRSELNREKVLATLPPNASRDQIECALRPIAADYDGAVMPLLVVEGPLQLRGFANRMRDELIARGVDAGRIRVADRASRKQRIRFRFDQH